MATEPDGRSARTRERPWLFRTYAGHSSAAASNALYRTNLARGQTGLSVAFDLPTQTGYDSDHPLAAGEVGRVGVPICSLSDMAALFEGIPLEQTNTSMTINATAPWLLALYVVVAEQQGAEPARLAGTVQNDLIKEYLARGTYIFPPRPSLKLIEDVIAFTAQQLPKWNPINVCSYHLQEAGATPVQELAYALATAIAVLDQVRAGGQVTPAQFPHVVGRISFFVNAGVRFVTEMCKLRAFAELWDQITAERYGVADPTLRRFRYGVQVNSLGLTEQQPENNVYRILLEALAVVLSKRARARAVQLPAWNEALGLPRPWDQQWSLRLQQILAYETDLLEYDDLFDGAPVVAAKVEELAGETRAELARIEAMGGALAAVESGYMKQRLVESNGRRLAAIAAGTQPVVGVNCFTEFGGVAACRRHGRFSHDRRLGRSRADRARAGPSRAPRRRRGGPRARDAAARGGRRREHHAALDRVRARRRHHRGMGRHPAAGIRRISGSHGRERRPAADRRSAALGRAGPGRPLDRAPAPTPQDAGRQAWARRSFQRRRADCAVRPRLRVRGGLRRHPPDARRASPPPRWRKACTSSACRSSRGRTAPRSRRCWRGCAPRAWTTCPWWSAASSRPRMERSCWRPASATCSRPRTTIPAR